MSSADSGRGGAEAVVPRAGRRWPAEWEPHAATWLSWPHNRETWPLGLGPVEDAFCEIVRAILPGERVEINVVDAAMASHVEARLAGAGIRDLDRVGLHLIPTNDAWVRDHGGIFVEQAAGVFLPGQDAGRTAGTAAREARLLDFEFDAWGGKYPPWDRDAAVAKAMARQTGVECESHAWVLEGGSIDGDGEGTILTTESCLLNPNRARPGQTRKRSALEGLLARTLGAERVLWLRDGIAGDDTDGHIDDLTRFVAPGRVVTIVSGDSGDVDRRILVENRARLGEMEDAAGRKLEVIELPTPRPRSGPHGRVPASYANFYFSNAAVLLPVFGCENDTHAIAILESCVSDRPVVPIPSGDLVLGLGSVHCLTQQQPVAPLGATGRV